MCTHFLNRERRNWRKDRMKKSKALHIPSNCLFRAVALGLLTNILAGINNEAAVVSIPAQNRASGVSWNLIWSNPNQEGHLGVGGSVAGQTGQTSTQLRFDLSSLNGAYSAINSVTIRLTQGKTDWSQSFTRYGGTIQAYRLKAENAGWSNNATFGFPDKTIDVTWAGGESGAMTPRSE